MTKEDDALATLLAKEEIRQLAMLYSRGVDRKDYALLRTLYAKDGTDTHGDFFDGSAKEYCDVLEKSLPHLTYSGHHICNHLIAVDGDTAEGEVYAIAWHAFPGQDGGMLESIDLVRYIDRYRKEDGRWYFAARVVTFDHRSSRPIGPLEYQPPPPNEDPTVTWLKMRIFNRGARA